MDFLLVNGVEAVFDDLYNDQFARILIIDEEEKTLGYFDIYHTRRKPYSPYLHNFKDPELKARMESLWREFAITAQ